MEFVQNIKKKQQNKKHTDFGCICKCYNKKNSIYFFGNSLSETMCQNYKIKKKTNKKRMNTNIKNKDKKKTNTYTSICQKRQHDFLIKT